MRSDVYINTKPDESLKESLISYFSKARIAGDRKELLAEYILLRVNTREASKRWRDKNPTTAEHREKIETYIESLTQTRKAWLALPVMTQEILPEMIPEIDSSLFSKEVTSVLSSKFYSDKTKLPDWRLKGLSNLESWGGDLEMIDLLTANITHWRDKYFVDFNRRDSSHIGLIAGIAELCAEHGIKISHAPRSHFVQILMLIFPNLVSPRASIKEAMALLEKSTARTSL